MDLKAIHLWTRIKYKLNLFAQFGYKQHSSMCVTDYHTLVAW